MPNVGKKHFAYDKAGYEAAQAYAKRTGKKVKMPNTLLRKVALARLKKQTKS